MNTEDKTQTNNVETDNLPSEEASEENTITEEIEAQVTHENTVNTADMNVDELQALLEDTQQESQRNLEGWQRTLAEFQNYKKRVERDLSDSHLRAKHDTLARLLPIIDDFERAMLNIPDTIRENPWSEGITLVQRKLLKLLEENDVVAVDPVGELFDPNIHEAIGTDNDTEIESGHITVTLQKGYKAGDRILRPALVRIAG